MLKSIPALEAINKFVEVHIPKASILFMKYGEKLSGHYTTDSNTIGDVQKVAGGSTISQMIHAQSLLKDIEL